jgi:hypothetical protein
MFLALINQETNKTDRLKNGCWQMIHVSSCRYSYFYLEKRYDTK